MKRDLPEGIDLLGPSEAPISVISGNFRMHLILRSSGLKNIYDFLRFFTDRIESPGGIYREIDVDPVNLL